MTDQSAESQRPERPSLVPLKLFGHWRKRTPPGYLGLDRVLDEVGRRDHPEIWGRLPTWNLMPFRYDKRKREYRGQRELRLVRGKPIVRSIALKGEFSRDELRASSELYRSVCERLLVAFETKALQAHALARPSGELTTITSPGLWSTQGALAFFTGLIVVANRDGQLVTARVLVRENEFNKWLQQQETRNTRQTDQERRQRIGRAIRDFAVEKGWQPTRDHVRVEVEHVIGPKMLTPKAAFADVWEALPPSPGGAPSKQQKAGYELHREALRARITAAAEGDNAPVQTG